MSAMDHDENDYDVWDDYPECDHADGLEINWEGRKECRVCSAFLGYVTNEEMDNYARWEQEYYEQMDREERRERWLRPLRWIKSLFVRRKAAGDEIPF